MSFDVYLRTKGEDVLMSFKNEQDFFTYRTTWYSERWLFFRQIVELVETREDLPRWGNFCGAEERVTDRLREEAEYWQDVYYRILVEREFNFKEFEKKRLSPVKQSFKYGQISNGDSGVHWKSVGEAFDWICHICGQQTERKGGTHLIRRGCTVDHIVPQSKGGANTWNNVLPAHWECNIKKNARI